MKKYQKVRTVGHREIADLLDGPVQIQEKVDGANFGFGKGRNGQVFCVSRTKDLSMVEHNGMFQPAVEYVRSIAHVLETGTIYRAEFLAKPRQNIIAYSRIPDNHLALFEIDLITLEGIVPAALDSVGLEDTAEELGISCVPFLFEGKATYEGIREMFDQHWASRESFLGGPFMEGIVIKNFNRFNADGNPLIGKLVRPEFKESQAHAKRTEKPSDAHTIGKRFGGEPRWQKAVQHLKEREALVNGPEDIGPLLREITQDVEAECIEEIKAELWKQHRKHVLAGAASGFPDWYKDKLDKELEVDF
jgi:hypothetical protein